MTMLTSDFYTKFLTAKFNEVVEAGVLDPAVQAQVTAKVEQSDENYDYTSRFNATHFALVVQFSPDGSEKLDLAKTKTFRVSSTEPLSDEVVKEWADACVKAFSTLKTVYGRPESKV